MSPRDGADLEWPLSEGMQVSALPPVWIAMSCWSVKLLKLPSVTLTHVCDTSSHNWWAKGLPGVGVVKIFYDSDSDSSGWKSFRLRLLDSDSTALIHTTYMSSVQETALIKQAHKYNVFFPKLSSGSVTHQLWQNKKKLLEPVCWNPLSPARATFLTREAKVWSAVNPERIGLERQWKHPRMRETKRNLLKVTKAYLHIFKSFEKDPYLCTYHTDVW